MENKKNQIKKQLEKTVDLSKNLQEPRNEEEQQMLDNIMNEINELNDYIDEISTVEGTDLVPEEHLEVIRNTCKLQNGLI